MKHFTVPPFRGTGCVKNPRMSTLMNPSKAFGLNSKKCIRRAVLGDPGVASVTEEMSGEWGGGGYAAHVSCLSWGLMGKTMTHTHTPQAIPRA